MSEQNEEVIKKESELEAMKALLKKIRKLEQTNEYP